MDPYLWHAFSFVSLPEVSEAHCAQGRKQTENKVDLIQSDRYLVEMVFPAEPLATGVALMRPKAGVNTAVTGQLLVPRKRPSTFTPVGSLACNKSA